MLSIMQFSKIFSKNLDSFKHQKFWTRDMKAMVND
jgi:hypothetical protein